MARDKTTRTARSAPRSTAQEAAENAAKHAPVALESGGSYDRSSLQKGLDRVVDKNADNRDAEVRKALDGASAGGATSVNAPNSLPDHITMRAEVQFAPGTEIGSGRDKQVVGSERGTEFRQVFNPEKAGEPDVQDAVVSGVALGDGTRTEILSLQPVGDQPAPAPTADTSVPAQDGETGEPGTTSNPEAVEQAIAASDRDQAE